METLRYYCYNCEEHFQQSQQASNCQICQSEAIELAPN
jgi:Zn finger protein HypA/HybF involved in hydrogenase expression